MSAKPSPASKPPAASKPTTAVGLLGGSFNPAHGGHLEISHAALKTFPLEEVWWLVSPGNPLKNPADYAAYETRLKDAKRLVDDPRIIVSDFEQRAGLQYTVDTVAALQRSYPETRFLWLMGADSLQTFHLWKNWRTIAKHVAIAVFNRPGAEDALKTAPAVKELSRFEVEIERAAAIVASTPPAWVFIPSTENPTSSTEIRKKRTKKATEGGRI